MSNPTEKYKFQLLSMTALNEQTTSDWLIPDLLFEGQVGMVYAEPGSFKSFIVLALASSLAHGLEWQGVSLDRGNVIYVAGEGAAMMKLRRQAWFLHHDIEVADDGLFVVPSPVDLTNSDDVLAFIEAAKQVEGVKLTVFDTLSTCVAGQNESSSEVMTAAIENAKIISRALGCAVLFVHHPGKDVSRGARGHSSQLGNVDTMWRVERNKDALNATLHVVKQKDGEDGQTFHFTATKINLGIHDRKGRERTSLCITESSEDEVQEIDEFTSRLDRITIAAAMKDGEKLSIRETAKRIMGTLEVGERTAFNRVKQAVPETWTSTRFGGGDAIAELRRVEIDKKKHQIEMRLVQRIAA